MTAELTARINGEHSYRRSRVASALNFVCGALIAHDAAQGSDPFEEPDVERVFAAIELLAERRTLEVSPFVAAWHPAVDAWDRLEAPRPQSMARQFRQALESSHDSDLARLLTKLTSPQADALPRGSTYAALSRRMLTELRQLVAVTEKKIGYLRPLVARGRQRGGLTIATLNYDLGIEGAAAAEGVRLSTGIESWLSDGRWGWPASGIRLLKLHGSINWVWDSRPPGNGELPREVVRVSEIEDVDDRPALVFGNRGKLRAQGPFLGLLAEFKEQLERAVRLIVIGYSFRDDHVNEEIRQWLSENRERKILVVDPAWPEDFERPSTPFQSDLENFLVPSDFDEPVFSPRLEIRREECGKALTGISASRR